jgi:hypothetical protein
MLQHVFSTTFDLLNNVRANYQVETLDQQDIRFGPAIDARLSVPVEDFLLKESGMNVLE